MCPMVKLAPQTNYYQGKIIDKKGSNQFGQGSPPNLDNAQKKGFFSERASFRRRINCCNSSQCSALMTTIMWCNVMFQVFRAFLVLAKIPMAIEKHQEGDRSHQTTGCPKKMSFLLKKHSHDYSIIWTNMLKRSLSRLKRTTSEYAKGRPISPMPGFILPTEVSSHLYCHH